MGFIRDWWNGTTAGAPGDRSGSKTQQVWRSTFDPGSNPNIGKVGSSYYDKPEDKSSVWDQILKHEDFKQRSFSDIDTNKDGYITREELQKAVGPNFHPQCGELSQ
eukprot:jgi/Chrzof1/12359/Cz06g31230.t1